MIGTFPRMPSWYDLIQSFFGASVMIRLTDIRSLTEFKRHAAETLEELKRTGRPRVLTVNGRAELVVQDVASYQRLLEGVYEA